jgi:hypothetical protein
MLVIVIVIVIGLRGRAVGVNGPYLMGRDTLAPPCPWAGSGTSKFQQPSTREIPIFKHQTRADRFEACALELPWMLDVETWLFIRRTV